jgi:CubicO group peptidase (beta-lactamase class C family)
MARLLRAVIDGSAPGADAVTPTTRIGDGERIGLGWFTSEIDGREVTWHNGGTGGFRSWIGFDRVAGRGVVVLSASDRDVDRLGEHLLGAAPPPVAEGWSMPGGRDLISLAFAVMALLIAVNGVRQVRTGRITSRADLVGVFASAVALLIVAWRRGPWMETSWLLWSLAAAVVGVATAAQCWYARHLPWLRAERRARAIAGAIMNAAFVVVFVVWIL